MDLSARFKAEVEFSGQALTLHLSGQKRIDELEAEWRRVEDNSGAEIVGASEATDNLARR
jgi:hypothetical protein